MIDNIEAIAEELGELQDDFYFGFFFKKISDRLKKLSNPWISESTKPEQKEDVILKIIIDGEPEIAIGYWIPQYKFKSAGFDGANDEYCEEADDYFFKEGWYLKASDGCEFTSWATDGTVIEWMKIPGIK